MEWKLERDLPAPIAEQLRGQIVYAISFGTLQPGEALPSVRALAGILKISPVTVSKVYRDLIDKGMLVSKPYVGVFVNELGLSNGKNHEVITKQNLNTILVNAVRQAKLMGYSMEEIRSEFSRVDASLVNMDVQKTILIISNYIDATNHYAVEIEEMLHDINVKVVPLIWSDLVANLNDFTPLLRSAQFAVTVPERLQDVRALLEPDYCRVLAVAFELSKTTVQRISAITPDQKIGIVSTIPGFITTMVNELVTYGPVVHAPSIALITQEEHVMEMLREVDVLIYASGSEIVREWAPKDLEMFEFLHTPKPESVNRLRSLL